MAHDDAAMRHTCRQLGLIPLLVNQLHLDIHQMDEPPLPSAAANILSLNTLPSTPRSPNKALGNTASAGGAASPFNPGSPLRRTGSSGSGSSSPRAVTTAGGRRTSGVEPPIPEESEMDDVDLPDSPGPSANGAFNNIYPGVYSHIGGRGAGLPHSSEAAALRGLGAGPSVVTRVAAAVLLRELLRGVMTPRTVEVLIHGMLLPALYMQVLGKHRQHETPFWSCRLYHHSFQYLHGALTSVAAGNIGCDCHASAEYVTKFRTMCFYAVHHFCCPSSILLCVRVCCDSWLVPG